MRHGRLASTSTLHSQHLRRFASPCDRLIPRITPRVVYKRLSIAVEEIDYFGADMSQIADLTGSKQLGLYESD